MVHAKLGAASSHRMRKRLETLQTVSRIAATSAERS